MEGLHRGRDGACPQAADAVRLDDVPGDRRGGLVGVLLGLQPRLDEVDGVGRPGRQRATEGTGSDIADKGVVVLCRAEESFGGGVAAEPDT